MSRRQNALAIGLEITVPLLLLVLWGVASAGSKTFYFPPLTDILSTFKDTWLFKRVGSDVVPSMERMFAGFFIAAALGVVGGLLLGLSPRARRAAAPIVEFLRAIPPPALLPFAILVVGVGASMKIFVIAFVCVWPILLNTIDGVRGIERGLEDVARTFRLTRRQRIFKIQLPSAAPQIFAGMRISLAFAFIMMIVTEMVGATSGIGFVTLNAQQSFQVPLMWAGMILLGLLGAFLNIVFLLVERRVLSWHYRSTGRIQ
jgi:ABC-type nitrate/sulfonate/bicarbonate transport system permease component